MMTAPVVAAVLSADVTALGVAVGLPARYSATTPATCGDAIDVPLIVLVTLFPVCQADVMLLPGAKMSTQLPKFENDDR